MQSYRPPEISCLARYAAVLLSGIALVLPVCAIAADYDATPADYDQLVAKLQPGDRLLLAAGAYLRGLRLYGIQGSEAAPIEISGPAAGPPAIFLARENRNTISIKNASHLIISNLILDGRNRPVDAVKAEGTSQWAHHITLQKLLIRNHGYDQQIVGISVQCPAWHWSIRENVIIGAGTGMYLGSSDGKLPFVQGAIEGNIILDTIGYNLQIKHQIKRPRLQGMPESAGATVIRGNVFSKGRHSSGAELARPNVLIGHLPLATTGSEDRYLIEGNLFLGNPAESLFQGEGNIVLTGNLFLNPDGNAIAIQPHKDFPRSVLVTGNLIAAKGLALRVQGVPPGSQLTVEDNEILEGVSLQSHLPPMDAESGGIPLSQLLERWFSRVPPVDSQRRIRERMLVPAIQRLCSIQRDADRLELSDALGEARYEPLCRSISVAHRQ
jgi:hypothetical protein